MLLINYALVMSGKIQEVILQEHLEKEDEVLVSLAGLKQVSLARHMILVVIFIYVMLTHAYSLFTD